LLLAAGVCLLSIEQGMVILDRSGFKEKDFLGAPHGHVKIRHKGSSWGVLQEGK